jgi:SAM-dependent methyltransferase
MMPTSRSPIALEPDAAGSVNEPFAAWAADLVDAVGPGRGDRVLDLSGGSGIVGRLVAGRIAPGGTVVALDDRAQLGETLAALPFADRSFDAVLCQQGLPTMSDREHVLRELRRVLRAGGLIGVSVWGPIGRSPAFAALADSLGRRAGPGVSASVDWLFSLPEPAELRALLASAGFGTIRVRTSRRTSRFGSVNDFLRRYVPGAPVAPGSLRLAPEEWDGVVADLEAELDPWIDARGLRVVTQANTAVAHR